MKKLLTSLVLSSMFLFPCAMQAGITASQKAGAEMSKKEAAAYLQQLMKDKVKEGAEEKLSKMAPKTAGLYKKMAAVISNSELAASLCWDLIQLGLQTDQKKFAAQFAMRLRKYIPEEYKTGADITNPMLESWVGHRFPNEADCTRVLYELGMNTYEAITKMSASEKQQAQQAGTSINNLNACMMGIAPYQWKRAANQMYGK